MKLAFTEEAIEDLEGIRQFLIEVEAASCQAIVEEIIASTENLLTFPRLGILVISTSRAEEIRDYLHKNYVFRYQITQDVIFILRVWHQRENARNE